jgi:hypothetical protein
MVPAFLPGGQVVLAGKSRIVYLLDGGHLGGIGGQLASLGAACSQDIDGGSAVVGSTIYLPCFSGTVAVGVTASPPALRLLWSSGRGGGPPIVAAGLVWTIGQNGTLYGLDPSTGAVRQQAPVGAPANHFPTPSVGDGLLLAPSADRVVAFATTTASTPSTTSTTSSTTSTTSSTPSTTPPSTTGSSVPHGGAAGAAKPAPGGGIGAGAIAGIVVGALAVLAVLGFLIVRRRRSSMPPGASG